MDVMELPAGLRTKAGVLEQRRGELAKLFADHKDAKGELTFNGAEIEEVNRRNDELAELAGAYQEATRLWQMEAKNAQDLSNMRLPNPTVPFVGGGEADGSRPSKSLGQQFVESKAYRDRQGEHGPMAEIPGVTLKTVMMTGGTPGGYPPQVLRSGVVAYTPQPAPTLIDMVPMVETGQNAYKFMQETTYTNAAAETAEGSLYPEAALQYAEVVSPIRKIPVFIPLTDEQLADQPGIRDIVDSRLALMIQQRLNTQLVNGNGTAPNLTGVLNVAGILTEAIGTDTAPDAVYKAIVKVMTVGFAEPSGVWFNPANWQTIRLIKTTFGSYIWGDPSQPGPATIFGLPVAQHVNVPAGTAIVGDYQGFTHLVYRAGIEFEISNSHSDFFARGQLALRAQMRCAFVVYRPSAICTVTGLS